MAQDPLGGKDRFGSERLERNRLVHQESADRFPTELGEVGSDPEVLSQVPGHRAKIRAGTHNRPKRQLGGAVLNQLDMMNGDAGWPERRGLAPPRPTIASLTGNVLGRKVGGTLKLGTQETDQGVADVALSERANTCRGRDDTAGQIVGVGLYAEPGGGEIGFGLFLNEASESGCGTQKHHQESGGKGIERSGVPCTSNSQHT